MSWTTAWAWQYIVPTISLSVCRTTRMVTHLLTNDMSYTGDRSFSLHCGVKLRWHDAVNTNVWNQLLLWCHEIKKFCKHEMSLETGERWYVGECRSISEACVSVHRVMQHEPTPSCRQETWMGAQKRDPSQNFPEIRNVGDVTYTNCILNFESIVQMEVKPCSVGISRYLLHGLVVLDISDFEQRVAWSTENFTFKKIRSFKMQFITIQVKANYKILNKYKNGISN